MILWKAADEILSSIDIADCIIDQNRVILYEVLMKSLRFSICQLFHLE